jgi:hypothetical protein
VKVEIIREITEGFRGNACLVRRREEYFVVSTVDRAFDTGLPETLAFAADADGGILSWTDIAGGVEKTREDTIAQLEADGDDPCAMERDPRVDPLKSVFGFLFREDAKCES